MPRIRCTPKVQFVVWLNVVMIFFAGAVILYLLGAIMFEREHSAKAIHVENICEVISSYSDQSYCSGGRGSSYVCYKPVWMVAYSIQEGGDEIRVDARIQHGGFRKAENAQNKLDEYQVSAVSKNQIRYLVLTKLTMQKYRFY